MDETEDDLEHQERSGELEDRGTCGPRSHRAGLGPFARKHTCRFTGETTKGSWPSSRAFLMLSPDSLQEGRKGSG